jgi:ABC-2 type transport system permease protein
MATLGRGYMPPLAFALFTLALGNVFGKTGWAVWFPWSIIPLIIGAVGKPVSGLPVGSYVVAALTFVVGVAATIAQVRWADTGQ